MAKFTDPTYLQTDQYRDASNLNARITIHQRFSTNPQGWFPWVWDVLTSLPTKAKVLELGCGSGALWMACPERIPAGWSITLSDFSAGMLDSAWRNLVTLGHGFKFEQIDAQSIPYADETFDIVIANHMLYHVPDRPKALSEIRRVLKQGGYLVATTVGEAHLRELGGWLRRADPEYEIARPTSAFNLGSGAAQLAPFFAPVTMSRYPDTLRVTDVDLLMAYIRSFPKASELSETSLAEVRREMEAELQAKGAILVTKDSGLFLARKSEKFSEFFRKSPLSDLDLPGRHDRG
jgi:ubiquinone/menaquinone biosynthesis C-methylase UbiE